MKISEMSLEQLQDYALSLEGEKKSWNEEKTALTAQLNESNELNRQLQKRNNDLFMKVEQGIVEEPAKEKEPAESCEDFAKNLVLKGVI